MGIADSSKPENPKYSMEEGGGLVNHHPPWIFDGLILCHHQSGSEIVGRAMMSSNILGHKYLVSSSDVVTLTKFMIELCNLLTKLISSCFVHVLTME